MSWQIRQKLILLSIIILAAAVLRLTFLGRADVVGDESINAFRSLGNWDFFAEDGQATAIDWFDPLPWWSHLSFHDHPPLSFWLNSLILNLFGPTPFAVRLLSALSGIISVLLLYLLAEKLFDQRVGFLAAGLLAVNNFAIWISRIGLQESLLISLILASLYFLVLARQKEIYLLSAFLFFGLALLTKYTAILLLPLFLWLILGRPAWRRSRQFYLGFLVFLAVISPVIIYNLNLFASRGHFDLQLSYIFGLADKVPGWQNLPGKSDLSLIQRLTTLPAALGEYSSWPFLVLALLAIIYGLSQLRRKNFSGIFLGLWLMATLAIITATGPQPRFLTLFLPPVVLLMAKLFGDILAPKKFRLASLIFLSLFLAYEVFYSFNTFFLPSPLGQASYTYSDYLFRERGSWGFNQLDDYLETKLAGKVPALRFQLSNAYLEQRVSNSFEKSQGQETPILLIYDFNIKDGPDIWYLKRRQFFGGWPLLTANVFVNTLKEQGVDYYLQQGFEKFYFIQPTNNTLLRPVERRTDTGQELGASLRGQGIEPAVITNLGGEWSFLVYEF